MRIRVLGPLEVWDDGRELPLGSGRQRALFVLLLLHADEVVSRDRLIDGLWGERPPASAAKVLQGYVSQLRRRLPPEAIVTRGSGYLLRGGETDAREFERLVERARAEEAREAALTLREALALWRGGALAEVEYEAWAQAEIARLEELRLVAIEERIEVDLQLGEDAHVVPELEALVAAHPLRERLRAQLMLALYRAGRQTDALDAFADARRRLVDELGVEPGPSLRELQQAILRQDPALEPVAPVASDAESVFVGRKLELEQLRAGLDEAFAGRGGLFLLAGEPGIGKSRLADELVAHARARRAHVLIGRCWEAGGAPAYWPWLQALRTYVRDVDVELLRSQLGPVLPDLAQLVPELRDRISDIPASGADSPEGARFRLFDAVATLLRRAGEQHPLVLVLDDLHAADEPSLLLLQFVARELAAARVLVVGAYRDVDPKPSGTLAAALGALAREQVTRVVSLSGLGEADVARFVELSTAHAPTADIVQAVLGRTEGNPLFVGEVVRLLSAAEPPGVPHSLKEVIAHRLRLLSPECRDVLSTAAVVGREFELDLLAAACELGRGAVLELLDEAMAEDVVSDIPGSRRSLRFAHALFRDGLYDELPPGRRRRLHETIGEALERLDPEAHLAELAYHFCEAVPAVEPTKAVEYARRAGDHAVSLLAPEEAIRLYDSALAIVDEHERPQLLLQSARSTWMAGAMVEERAVEARDALLASGDTDGAAQAELLLASVHWFEGRRRLVSEDMRRATALVRDRPVTPTTADVLDHASRFHMLADENEDAIAVGREALQIAERLGLHGVRAHCLSNIGVARACLGDLGGLDDIRKALEVALAAHDGWAAWRARANLADCLLWQVGEAEPAFAERHALRSLLHAAGSWPVARWNQAYDAAESYWRGSWRETVRLCDEFLVQVEAGNRHNTAAEMYSLRSLVRVAQGDERSLDDARAGVAVGRASQDPRILYPALGVNAQVAAELGWDGEADELLEELLLATGPEPFPAYVVSLSLGALARGRAEDALPRIERLGPSPWRDAALELLRGEHVEAAERFSRIGVLPEEAHARLLGAEAGAEAEPARCRPFFELVGATAYLRRLDLL
jgi:DNA-binding SARP family transcriptional activator